MKLPGPVQVEVYPDHEDFAVRTMACRASRFGRYLRAGHRHGQPVGPSAGRISLGQHAVHEMSHVYILTATNFRVPRWFTEGLAVHEETEASPEWGDRITPEILVAIRDKKLLPSRSSTWIYPSRISRASDRVLLSGWPHLRLHQGAWGADKLLDMVALLRRAQNHPRCDPWGLEMAPEEFEQAISRVARQGRWQNGGETSTVAHEVEGPRGKPKTKTTTSSQRGEEVRPVVSGYILTREPIRIHAEADWPRR